MKNLVGVFDDENGSDETSRVKYNDGSQMIHAVVTHVVDEKNLVLATWQGGVFTLLNEGNPVPERAEKDYGPEGGGVTWTR